MKQKQPILTGFTLALTLSSVLPVAYGEPSPPLAQTPQTFRDEATPVEAPSISEITAEVNRNCHVAIVELQQSWMSSLLERRRYADVLQVTDMIIRSQPQYTWAMSFLLSSRIEAELQMGLPQNALQDAKRLYFVAPMAETEAAMLQVERCLHAVYPDDVSIAKQFIKEQVDGSETAGNSSVLLQIVLKPSGYSTKYEADAKTDSYRSGEGNLLLLDGEVQRALEVFQTATESAKSAVGHHTNVNDIARAMKARDGVIADANAYLRAQAAMEAAK